MESPARFAAALIFLCVNSSSAFGQDASRPLHLPDADGGNHTGHEQHDDSRRRDGTPMSDMQHRITNPLAVSGDEAIGKSYTDPPPVPSATAPDWFDPGAMDVSQVHNLESLLSLAAANNPTLRQARLHINAELNRAVQAGLYPNPTVAVIGEQIGLNGTAGEWVGAEIGQTFVTGGKLKLSRNKYLQRAKVAEHKAMAQQFRVCNDIRIHFYRSLAALEMLSLKQELLKTAEDHMLTAREMYNLGQANQASLQQEAAALQMHRLAVMRAKSHVRRSTLELSSLAGSEMTDIQIDGVLRSDQPLIDFDVAFNNLIECSPELLAANAKLREDCITVNRERVEWIPNLQVSAGPGYNNVDRQTTVAARIGIEVPLFDRNQGTIEQAQADYTRQMHEIRRLRLDLRKRLAGEYDNYISAVQHVTEFESVILPAKRKAYELALTGYKCNRSEWPDVLAAQEAYTNARLQLVQHQESQRTSEVLINGFLLHGGLVTPDGPVPGGHIDAVPKPR